MWWYYFVIKVYIFDFRGNFSSNDKLFYTTGLPLPQSRQKEEMDDKEKFFLWSTHSKNNINKQLMDIQVFSFE